MGRCWSRGWRGALIVAWLLLLAACGRGEDAPVVLRPAVVEQPQRGGASSQAYAGEVRARHEPQLAFRVAGEVARRLAEIGDRVAAGQVLAELDPDDTRLQADSARAAREAAEADLALARSERDRHAALIERQIISRSQFESIQNRYEAAQAQAEQARSQQAVAGNQAGYTRLVAPVAGVVTAREVEAGQVVAAGQVVYVLAADGEREVAIAVPERRLPALRVGQPVQVTLWSQPERVRAGHIREIAPAAEPVTRTYAVRVALDEADGAELGQSARVAFEAEAAAALSVPLSAVAERDGEPALWVLDPATETVSPRRVRLGPYGEARVPVLEGVGADDWIVVAGVHLLGDGQRVRPVDRDNRPRALGAAGGAD